MLKIALCRHCDKQVPPGYHTCGASECQEADHRFNRLKNNPPKTITLDVKRLRNLLVEWHYDCDGYDSDKAAKDAAKDYATRLLFRMAEETQAKAGG